MKEPSKVVSFESGEVKEGLEKSLMEADHANAKTNACAEEKPTENNVLENARC